MSPGAVRAARCSLFDPAGSLLWELEPHESGLEPFCAAAVDAAGHLWVSEQKVRQALEFDGSGNPPAQIGSFPYTTNGGICPCSIDLDSAGNALRRL